MTVIELNLQSLRKWFIEHNEYSIENAKELPRKFKTLLELLIQGEQVGLKIGSTTCGALHDSFSRNLTRVQKINRPNEIIFDSVEENDVEIIYKKVFSTIIVSLAPNFSDSNSEFFLED